MPGCEKRLFVLGGVQREDDEVETGASHEKLSADRVVRHLPLHAAAQPLDRVFHGLERIPILLEHECEHAVGVAFDQSGDFQPAREQDDVVQAESRLVGHRAKVARAVQG